MLRSPDGFTIADSVHFGTGAMDQSYARQPDAIGPFEWVHPTPGECNGCPETTVNVFGGDYRGFKCQSLPSRSFHLVGHASNQDIEWSNHCQLGFRNPVCFRKACLALASF